MVLLTGEFEAELFLTQVLYKVARRSGVRDVEFYSNDELLQMLSLSVRDAYLDFRDTYREYVKIGLELDKAKQNGLSHNVVGSLSTHLGQLVQARDLTRMALLKAMPV